MAAPIKRLSSDEFRLIYRKFAESHGHAWIAGATLVPQNDPSVLFTTAGMQPLVPNLLGEPHPQGKRLANIQRCLRTVDFATVGDATHNTFFEMLGYWSLGDYFKDKAIAQTWQFLTSPDWLGLDPERFAVTVFAGDANAPRDKESAEVWMKQLGFVGGSRIAYLDKEENWWPAGGGTGGPCGPDSETFYWTGAADVPHHFDPTDEHWVEVCNNVFIEFERHTDGTYTPLKQRSVDMGMGFARMMMILQQCNTVYETDLFKDSIESIRRTGVRFDERAWRIIADHLRAAVFLAMDGVVPSNKDQGYVMRRLIRRAVATFGLLFESHEQSAKAILLSETLVPTVIACYQNSYPELAKHKDQIVDAIKHEEQRFLHTLSAGMERIAKLSATTLKESKIVSGQIMFDLFTTYGIPTELQPELFGVDKQLEFDTAGFDQLFAEHQRKSQAGAAQKFKGGLSDHSERVVRMHTATHLLHEALRRILGDHVEQRGSNITSERLRFDFAQPTKMTGEEIKQVEKLVNDVIEQDLPVERQIVSKSEASKMGARAIFGEKYGDEVSVYSIGPDEAGGYFSREFCGGPHVTHTSEIGKFHILKEEASSAGIRRIKATVD